MDTTLALDGTEENRQGGSQDNSREWRETSLWFYFHEEMTENRVDARIIDHQTKRVITLEVSCPWITNRMKKTAEKTLNYGPLSWELKQQHQGYEVRQYNIIMDVLGGWSRDLHVTMKELVGSRSKRVLQNMQKAVLSGSLNIARTFKVAT